MGQRALDQDRLGVRPVRLAQVFARAGDDAVELTAQRPNQIAFLMRVATCFAELDRFGVVGDSAIEIVLAGPNIAAAADTNVPGRSI